ncbi:MAG: hypothetical protein QXW77_04290, partial [Candidatus Hadarchaeales archaeon]
MLPVIFYAENEGLRTASDTYTDVCTLNFTILKPGDYLVLAQLSLGHGDATTPGLATLLVDGSLYGEAKVEPNAATTPRYPIGWIKKVSLSSGSHTIKIQAASGLEGGTVYVENVHIVALRLPTGSQYNETEVETTTGASEDNIVVLSFTPSSTDNYMIFVSFEYKATANTDITVKEYVDSQLVYNAGLEAMDATNYRPVVGMQIFELSGGSQHTIRVTASGGAGRTIRKTRIAALPIGAFRWYLDGPVNLATSNAAWTLLRQYSPPISATENYLLLSSHNLYALADAQTRFLVNTTDQGAAHCGYYEDPEEADDRVLVLWLKRRELSPGDTINIMGYSLTAGTNIYLDNSQTLVFFPYTYIFDVQQTIMALTGQDNYELQIRYYVGGESGDSENVFVYLWNYGTGQWDAVGVLSGGTPASPNLFLYDLTGTNYILGSGEVRVRFVQPNEDLKATYLAVDYVRIKNTTYLAPGQSLRWQHTITGVSAGYENYDLKIRGYAYGDPVVEDIYIYVWNVSTNDWEFLNDYIPKNTPSTRTFRLSPISNYLDGDSIHVKFEDSNPSDSTTTYVILDMVRIEEAFWGTSDVKLQVRVSEDNISWTDWMGPDGTSNTYFEAATTSMENIPDNRYIQYRIYFSTNTTNLTGANGPKVDWVKINASTLPNLISPADGSTTNNPTPTFYWETVAADNYHLQIATDPDFTNLVVDNENIPGSENTWTPTSPLADNLYYWRVQRRYNNKWYAWVATWSFRIDTLAPSPPDLYSPADGTITNDNTPWLEWTVPNENSYPLTYQLMISRNTSFTDLVPGYDPSPWLSDNFHEVSELSDGTYYWKVKAKDNAGNEGFYTSYYWSFRIDTKPPAVPSPIATLQYVRPQPNLDWPAVTLDNSGATELTTPIYYQVYISTDPGFPAAATQTSGWITDDNWIATPATANNTTYYWKVCARDNIWN